MNLKFLPHLILTTSLLHGQSVDKTTEIIELEPFIVQSSPLAPSVDDLTQYWSVLDGQNLELQKAQTIGETLAREPGVSQSFYGPNASRPIIRGLDNNRVRILKNGLDTFDVSAASVDHAVAVDPLLLDRIEILRGSSALLYGANAIGGVVNSLDRTIPTQPLEDGVEGQTRTSYTSVNDGWNTGAVAFAGNEHFVFQAHGSYRETNDYDVPTFTLPDGTRTDTVSNSQSESWTGGFGASYLFEDGFIGASFSQFDTDYGVPNEEAPTIDLENRRIEIKGEIEPASVEWLKTVELQIAWGDYEHNEIEGNGDIAATFKREGIESRLSIIHAFGEIEGVIGIQGNYDDSSVSGEENFFAGASGRNPTILSEEIQRIALFILEDYSMSSHWSLNAGLRIEHEQRDFEGANDQNNTNVSASGGIVFQPAQGWSLSGNINYTERQPDAAELFSDGPHLATGAFEVGNPSLDKESALGFEVILRKNDGPLTGQLSAFYTQFDNYIFLADTGVELNPEGNVPGPGDEALAERIYQGVSAEFYGLESEINWRVIEQIQWTIDVHGFADITMAKNTTTDTNLPRIPPWRIGTGVDFGYDAFSFGLRLTHTGKQTDTAPGESTTGSHTLLDAYASYRWKKENYEAELFVKGSNLTDELALVHTSFLRDTAPLPGTNIEVGMNFRF